MLYNRKRFRGVATSYYKGALGVFLVYDITRAVTFDNMGIFIVAIIDNFKQDGPKK